MPVFGAGVCGRPITELDALADETVRKLLYLDNEVTHLNERDIPGHAADMRHIMPDTPQHHQYYQVRAGKLGFISGLSILDLLFNIGPEAPLYLKKLIG